MYGLLVEGVGQAIKNKYGDKVWNQIRKKLCISKENTFNIHKCYSETLMIRIVKATAEVTGDSYQEIMELAGDAFVTFVGQYGYDRILRVLGRHLRDFLNGLDNLHEYLRFSYPKLKPPSFFVEDEGPGGLTLHYRSRRKGYVNYVMGQIKAVSLLFFQTEVDIEVLKQEEGLDSTSVVMRLHFDNTAYTQKLSIIQLDNKDIDINSDVFFEVFPFHIVFDRNMIIRNVGVGLSNVVNINGQCVDEVFHLSRPMVEFSLENVKSHSNNAFELISNDSIQRMELMAHGDTSTIVTDFTNGTFDSDEDSENKRRLKLKGQMLFMESWDAIIFIGTPIMSNLETMFDVGLYLNDLSMHDSSRDLVLAGTQQQAELKLALDQEQQKAQKLGETMTKLDEEMRRTDSLLYQMIPRTVAERLRKGEPALNTCEIYDEVTILFSDVVGFTKICSHITPMDVVSLLNDMYTTFDKLTEKHRVYKVETIGDAYMVVSGAPDVSKFHALHIADLGFSMLDGMKQLVDPSSKQHLQIRIGIHSGMVVGGVVGLKMPRWCLFGDTVTIANIMEAKGEAMKIQISQASKEILQQYPYTIEERGLVDIKDGEKPMMAYWLKARADMNSVIKPKTDKPTND